MKKPPEWVVKYGTIILSGTMMICLIKFIPPPKAHPTASIYHHRTAPTAAHLSKSALPFPVLVPERLHTLVYDPSHPAHLVLMDGHPHSSDPPSEVFFSRKQKSPEGDLCGRRVRPAIPF